MAGFPDIEKALEEFKAGRPGLLVERAGQLQRLAETHEFTILALREELQNLNSQKTELQRTLKALLGENHDLKQAVNMLRAHVPKEDAFQLDEMLKKYGG